MKVKIDKNKCIGCGACASICPEGFSIGDDGKAEVKNPESGCAKEASKSCPVNAIKVE